MIHQSVPSHVGPFGDSSHLSPFASHFEWSTAARWKQKQKPLDSPSRHPSDSIFWPALTCASLALISCFWYPSQHSTLVVFAMAAHVLEWKCTDHYWCDAKVSFLPSQPAFHDDLKAVFDYASTRHSTPSRCQWVVRGSFVDGFGWEAAKYSGVTALIFELLNLDGHPSAGGWLIHTPKKSKCQNQVTNIEQWSFKLSDE